MVNNCYFEVERLYIYLKVDIESEKIHSGQMEYPRSEVDSEGKPPDQLKELTAQAEG